MQSSRTSTSTAAEITRIYGVPSERIDIMPNGYDATEFNAAVRTAHRTPLRTRLALSDQVVLLFVANELHRKGFSTLLEAVASVDDPRVRIEVVGRADPATYHDRIAVLDLADRVRWNGPQSDIAPWYAAADLLVLPTRYEPFGNVIVEALACGLPVITTAVAGASSVVVPGVNGLLQQDPTDVSELAGLLRTALDGDHLQRWTRDARTGIARFEWSEVAGVLGAKLDALAPGAD